MGIQYLSASQMAMYGRCGEQYRRRYMEGEIRPPGISLLVGSGVHGGIETNFTQKIDSHSDLAPSVVQDAAVARLEERLEKDGCELNEEEQSKGKDAVIGEATDVTATLAYKHASEVAPAYQPIAVEKRIEMPVPKLGIELVGYIDLADDQQRIVDFKTSGKSMPNGAADTSIQLGIYSLLYASEFGKLPSETRLEVLTKAKTPKRQMLSSVKGPSDLDVLARRIQQTVKGIEAGIFQPAEPDSWACSERFCGYASTCPFFMKRES